MWRGRGVPGVGSRGLVSFSRPKEKERETERETPVAARVARSRRARRRSAENADIQCHTR